MRTMRTDRRFLSVACLRRLPWLVACVLALACHGGGGDDDGAPHLLAFQCSESMVPANTVALACGALSQNMIREVQVLIGGPTTSNDVMGFSFDIVFDPANISYVAGSAGQGTLLSSDGDDPLLAVDLASNDPGRLLVGIHRANQASGVAGPASSNLVLRFSMRANALVAFGPDLLRFENAEVVDSSGTAIPGITFSDQLLLGVN